ncbi:hypothetical protein [Escherichia marmotae]|uniref:hypothetical protein n=1 Tax=Escherichia marmotae TaxID=1499973 RepID=UPI0027DFA7DD|nr:hypothetical protein [Escherichia marmotae]
MQDKHLHKTPDTEQYTTKEGAGRHKDRIKHKKRSFIVFFRGDKCKAKVYSFYKKHKQKSYFKQYLLNEALILTLTFSLFIN